MLFLMGFLWDKKNSASYCIKRHTFNANIRPHVWKWNKRATIPSSHVVFNTVSISSARIVRMHIFYNKLRSHISDRFCLCLLRAYFRVKQIFDNCSRKRHFLCLMPLETLPCPFFSFRGDSMLSWCAIGEVYFVVSYILVTRSLYIWCVIAYVGFLVQMWDCSDNSDCF